MVSAPHDPKGRLIAIFVGAVLLPSLALSYVSITLVPKLAESHARDKLRQAERTLYYIEKDLEQNAQTRALEAARILGPDRLLDGRPEVVQAALREAGAEPMFESLHLEGASLRIVPPHLRRRGELPRELFRAVEPYAATGTEDSVPWTGPSGKAVGLLRFRFACDYAHGKLIRDYFEREFNNPDRTLVVRVTEDASVLYETDATPDGRFEVSRKMESPSFRDLNLHLRYRERSIEKDMRHWERGAVALIGLIDLILGAGLYLVYSNVRRELHLSRLKSDFVANVSHELKTPLALIRLFAETLEMGRVAGEEKAKQYYRVINKESQRLTQLINNILDFSRIEAGRKEYRLEPADVSAIVSEVVEAYRFPIEQQGFTLEVNIEPDLPAVEADKEALGQALLNLMNNAIKYSGEEKHLRLDVRRSGEDVLISVTDRGIGVAKAEQKKIFEKFYRAEDSLVHATKGSGLGLPLVRHIMEAHGGAVEVESAPRKGSTFTLRLPIPKENG
jgi:signal transduction histidine kinase